MIQVTKFAVAVLVLCTGCSTHIAHDKSMAPLAAPTSMGEAVQWLKADGFGVLSIDRATSGQLNFVSRSSTHYRTTVFNAHSFVVMEDTITPIRRSGMAAANHNSDDLLASETTLKSPSTPNSSNGNVNLATATATSSALSSSASGNASGSTQNGSATTASASTNAEHTSTSQSTTSSETTITTGSISNSATGTASASTGP